MSQFPKKKWALIIAFLVISFAVFYIAAFAFNLGNIANVNSQNGGKTTDSDRDGLTDWDETHVYHTDPHNPDTDGDYVRDDIEIKHGFDPLKKDTDGGGIDDFNELYTYQSDPSNPSDDKAIIHNLPNVKVRHWNLDDGGVGGYTPEKYVEISMRDPLVKWNAERSEIKWETGPNGEKSGKFYINNELAWNGEKNNSELTPSIDQPSYFLSHGREGSCGDSSLTNLTILKSMGYDSKLLTNDTHAWVEAVINGVEFEVNFNGVYQK